MLTVPERHQLRIASDTLKMPDAMVGIMGGPDKAESRRIIFDLTGRWPCDNHPSRKATHSKSLELMCDECTAKAGGLSFTIKPEFIEAMPSIFGTKRGGQG